MDNKTNIQEVNYIPTEEYSVQKLKPEHEVTKRDTFRLYMSVLTVELLVMINGSNTVWFSPVLVVLKSNDSTINPLGRPIEPQETSLVIGIPHILGLVAPFVFVKIADIFGRKFLLLILGIPILFSGVALAFSNTVIYMILAKAPLAFALGAVYSSVPVYVAEISERHNRAKFGCFTGLFHQIGHFVAYIVGPFFSVKTFTLIIFIPGVIFLIVVYFIPESPVFLISKNKERECKAALRILRSNKTQSELDAEFLSMKENIIKERQMKNRNFWLLFKRKELRIGLVLTLIPLMTQHLSGVSVVMAFLAPIFNSAGTKLSGNTAAIIVICVKLICFLTTSFVVERFGKKRLMLISSVGVGIPLFGLGMFFYLKHLESTLLIYLQWLPLVAILSNVVLYAIGLGPIPMAIISEFFPTEYRATATAFLHTAAGIIVLVLTSSYPIITEYFGAHWCMWAFSFFCFIGATLIYFFLPETKGMSFGEIQDILKNYTFF